MTSNEQSNGGNDKKHPVFVSSPPEPEDFLSPAPESASGVISPHDDAGASLSTYGTGSQLSTSISSRASSDSHDGKDAKVFRKETILVVLALFVSLIAVVASGVTVFISSSDFLLDHTIERGRLTVQVAAKRLQYVRLQVETSVDECFAWLGSHHGNFSSLAEAYNSGLPVDYLHYWGSRNRLLAQPAAGFTVNMLFPVVNSGKPATQSNDSSCGYVCRRPADPHFTSSLHMGVWNEILASGQMNYMMSLSSPSHPTVGRVNIVNWNAATKDPSVGPYIYNYSFMHTLENGTLHGGQWIAPHPWITIEGKIYFFLSYHRTDYVDQRIATICHSHSRVVDWHRFIIDVLPTSHEEVLILADSNMHLLTSSNNPIGDERYANCSFSGALLLVSCAQLTVRNHPDPFIRDLFAPLIPFAASTDKVETYKIQGSKYIVYVQTVMDFGTFQVFALWAVKESVVLKPLTDSTWPPIVLCTLFVLISSVTLAVIARIFVHNARATTHAAQRFVYHLASYDLDRAAADLAATKKSSGDTIMLTAEFEQLLSNLETYRPFLPAALRGTHGQRRKHRADSNELEDEDNVDEDPPAGQTASAPTTALVFRTRLARLAPFKFRSVKGTALLVQLIGLPIHDHSATEMISCVFVETCLEVFSNFGGNVEVLQTDFILVTFNAHRTVVYHEEQACVCAYALDIALHGCLPNREYTISIASGRMLTGNCGDKNQISRIAFGTPVALAYKLARLQRFIGCRIATSGPVAQASNFVTIPVDRARLVFEADHKLPEVDVHQLLYEEKVTNRIERYNKGVFSLHNKRLEDAITCFQSCLQRSGSPMVTSPFNKSVDTSDITGDSKPPTHQAQPSYNQNAPGADKAMIGMEDEEGGEYSANPLSADAAATAMVNDGSPNSATDSGNPGSPPQQQTGSATDNSFAGGNALDDTSLDEIHFQCQRMLRICHGMIQQGSDAILSANFTREECGFTHFAGESLHPEMDPFFPKSGHGKENIPQLAQQQAIGELRERVRADIPVIPDDALVENTAEAVAKKKKESAALAAAGVVEEDTMSPFLDPEGALFPIFLPAQPEDDDDDDEATTGGKKKKKKGRGSQGKDTMGSTDSSMSIHGMSDTIVDSRGHTWVRFPKVIGSGAFSTVHVAMDEATGRLCALKAISLSGIAESLVQPIVDEITTLSAMHHSNIVTYISCAVPPNFFCVLMEYVPCGTLRDLLSVGPASRQLTIRVLEEILSGLRYMHERHVVHCDIKPDNILIAEDSSCKLADFGSCVRQLWNRNPASPLTQKNQGQQPQIHGLRGTPLYMAPECMKGSYSPESDVWSMGVVLCEVLSGSVPWPAATLLSVRPKPTSREAGSNAAATSATQRQVVFSYTESYRDTKSQEGSINVNTNAFLQRLATDERYVPDINALKQQRQEMLKTIEWGRPEAAVNVADLWDIAARCVTRDPSLRPSVDVLLREVTGLAAL